MVVREPGYYNPDNPFDTGRPGESNSEYRGQWDPSMERRMAEPGVTPWGPAGRASPASPAGVSPGPPGQPSQAQGGVSHPRVVLPRDMWPGGTSFQRALLGSPTSPVRLPEGVPDANQEFLAVLAQLVGKIPRWDPRQRGRVPYE